MDDDEDEDDDEEDEDIALSDLESVASEDKGDVIPHQRLTINNTAALLRAVKSFALSSKLPFSENQVIISDAPTDIPDMDDDLNRELAFYKQSLDAVTKARGLLKKEGVPFSRPADYFAEMVKSDEHMGKIKGKLIDEAASKKASAEARRQRDLKKFGKQVQVAKLQERSREKKDTMDKIQLLKRSKFGLILPITQTRNANRTKQRERAKTLATQTKTTCSTSPSKTPPRRKRRTRPLARPVVPLIRAVATRTASSVSSATKSTALAARSASPRATTQSHRATCLVTRQRR
jgi:hypothetical protein